MAKTVIISDDLAARVEARRQVTGLPTLDAAAEALIAHGLALGSDEDHSAGRSDEELRAALEIADASGPAEPWDAKAIRNAVKGAASSGS